MNSPNTGAYRTLGWIVNEAESGLFLLIAPEVMQRGIVERYDGAGAAVYDYREHPGPFSFNRLELRMNEQPEVKVWFLRNFHLAVSDERGLKQLNFSRDLLEGLRKNIVFCVTPRADDMLARQARVFYSYVRLRMFFEDEGAEDGAGPEGLESVIDLSTGVELGEAVDFTQPKTVLLTRAIALVNKAGELEDEFRYKDALAYLRKALEIRVELLGEEHPDTAAVYERLGETCGKLAMFDEALEWSEKAVDIRERVLGYEHADTAESYHNIARVYSRQGEYAKALEWYNKALKIREKVLGNEHTYTAMNYHNIAEVHYIRGDYNKSLELSIKALRIFLNKLGDHHPDTYSTVDLLSDTYTALYGETAVSGFDDWLADKLNS